MHEFVESVHDAIQFPEAVQLWLNDALVWIGFGTLAGLLAKGIVPGGQTGGTVATLAMAIGGTIVGCGIGSLLLPGQRLLPISPWGIMVATTGAFSLLFFYRWLVGHRFSEGGEPSMERRREVFRTASHPHIYHPDE